MLSRSISATPTPVTPRLESPVSALAVIGNILLIGQEAVYSEASFSEAGVFPIRSVNLNHGAIRAILPHPTNPVIRFILTAEGLIALNSDGEIVSFLPGGGQRLAVSGERLYIAALGAGIRIVTWENKMFRIVGQFVTAGAAEDVAVVTANPALVWVAEREQGVRLYDLSGSLTTPSVALWIRELNPARRVRPVGSYVWVGYANRVGLVDVSVLRAPKLVGSVEIGGRTAYAGALALNGARLLVGRVDQSGADLVLLDSYAFTRVQKLAELGDQGGGDEAVWGGEAVFFGSARSGLGRGLQQGVTLQLTEKWQVELTNLGCVDKIPVAPDPPHLGQVEAGRSVRLRWGTICPAARYEVFVNGQALGVVTGQMVTLNNPPDRVEWQVVGLDPDQQYESQKWVFELRKEGVLTPARPLDPTTILYTPPLAGILETPNGVLIATCAASGIGLLVVIGGAWLIGRLGTRFRDADP